MHIAILAGGIASGKSTVAAELERLGCRRIDLDQLSRELLGPGSPIAAELAEAFGPDLLDPKTSALDRALLARRAFATAGGAARLEAIELPAIRELLARRLGELASSERPPAVCIVEVPLLDRLGDASQLADEVVVVACPHTLRRRRALERGMSGEDFDARAANQVDDAWLRAHADTVLENDGSLEELLAQARDWLSRRGAARSGRGAGDAS